MSPRVMGWIEGAGRVDTAIGTIARLGAMPDNDVVVRVDGVSRTHARIVGEQDGFWVEDANSKNGTWLNGERVKRARLKHLDIITLGRFAELVFVEREGAETSAPPTTSGIRVRLEPLDGSRRGDVIDIPTGETLMGRAESCAIVVDTPAVSRAHARISNSGGRIVIEDLGSANGTTVNGQLIKGPTPLSTGDEVVLGDARRFRVMIDGAVSAAATPTQVGEVGSRSQDMEWATRLVFSAEDLEAISRAAGGIDKPSPPPMRPVGKAPQVPIVPVPPPAAPPANVQATVVQPATPPMPSAPPPPAAAQAAPPASVEGTRLGGADLRVPTAIGRPSGPPTTADGGTTQMGGFGPVAPPFEPPKFTPPAAAPPPTDAIPERTMFDRGAMPAAGNNLPPSVRRGESSTRRVASAQIAGSAGTFALGQGTSTIGRSPDATIRIESRELSRIHAAFTVTPQGIVVEDRGSVNGTTVNGNKITGPTPVAAGDLVAFANVEFRVDVTWTEGN